jgi:hypothetical protein
VQRNLSLPGMAVGLNSELNSEHRDISHAQIGFDDRTLVRCIQLERLLSGRWQRLWGYAAMRLYGLWSLKSFFSIDGIPAGSEVWSTRP